MPSKRMRVARPLVRQITRAAIAAYRAGDWLELHRELGLRPWEASPLDVRAGDPPPGRETNAWAATWQQAAELREELERAD